MAIVLLAIVDFARIYTTTMTVESAAREAADFGTTFGAMKWDDFNRPMTEERMQTRACVAASNLPDYLGDAPGTEPTTCTNPSFDYCVTPTVGGACVPIETGFGCEDPDRATPCAVTVTLTYEFHLLAPFHIEFLGVQIGMPNTLNFQRDSTFAITDIALSGAGS